MPRAVPNPKRLYTPQITSLQTLLRLTSTDERIPPKVRQQISAEVAHLVTVLSSAQAEKHPDEIK